MTQQQMAASTYRRGFRIGNKIYPYISILPVFLVIALFAIYPIFYAVRMSFFRYILTKPNDHPFIALKNFSEVIQSYYFKNSLQVTGIYTVAAVLGVILFGLGVALLLNTKMLSAT